jgi:hypothetical protein
MKHFTITLHVTVPDIPQDGSAEFKAVRVDASMMGDYMLPQIASIENAIAPYDLVQVKAPDELILHIVHECICTLVRVALKKGFQSQWMRDRS